VSETASTMLALQTKAPDFTLLDVCSDQNVTLTKIKSSVATVIVFTCNHCPYVLHIQQQLVKVSLRYLAFGIQFVAINANNIEKYPADSPQNMKLFATEYGFSFPYLFDADQTVAKAYHAACTPDFFVFDKDLLCVYRGRFDGATPGNHIKVTGVDLTNALDGILEHRDISSEQKPSLGCNIKWR
jgi:peroxiredoxin